MGLKIKICGITNAGDAMAAIEAGADALGFMFYEQSPRNVSIASVAKIARELPPFVSLVGVFVDPAEELIAEAQVECGLDALQFHGQESPAFCEQFANYKIIKSFRIQGAESLRDLAAYQTAAWLLDSHVPGQLGGTGTQFNWDLAGEVRKLGRPIILAGGLTAGNVAEAVRQVHPYAVDVSTGVESAPGKKDPGKLREFITAARKVDSLDRDLPKTLG